MNNTTENDQDAERRNTKNIKDLWRDAVRALKSPTTTSGSTEHENRSVSQMNRDRIVYSIL